MFTSANISATQYLFRFEACEAEHPDLVDDMLPVVGGALTFETSHQLLSHLNDAVSHTMDLLKPRMNEGQKNRFWMDI